MPLLKLGQVRTPNVLVFLMHTQARTHLEAVCRHAADEGAGGGVGCLRAAVSTARGVDDAVVADVAKAVETRIYYQK